MKRGHVKIRILDEVSMVLVGLSDEHLEYFYNKYGVYAPNYYFNPKFKLGQWDGKIRYFHKTAKTYLYLIDDILPRIVDLGYKVEIDDLRNANVVKPEPVKEDIFQHIAHMETGLPIILRDDQLEGINVLIEHGYGICVAGTGAGKTLMCAALVSAYGALGIKSLTIVPDQSLIRQTKLEYINCKLDVGEYSGLNKTLNHQHVVSTWQALKNNPKVVNMFDMVIVDECHGLRGNVLSKIVTDHAAKMPYRFGFTGTLPKEPSDVLAVHTAVGPQRFEMKARALIDKGVLANLHIDIIQLEEDLKDEWQKFCNEEAIGKPPTYVQFKDSYFPDFASEKAYLHRHEDRIEWIARYIETRRDMKKGNVLCLVDNIAFGRKITDQIEGAIFVNGKDVKSPVQRQKVYDLFKERDDLVVIATVHIAGTGLNIRRIFNLMMVDIGKSFIRVIQAIGRGLRRAEDKTSVGITDLCSDLKYGKRHCRQRINHYDEAQYPHKKYKVDYMEQLRSVDM
jgi:superfamily II DNA or RNA helicase